MGLGIVGIVLASGSLRLDAIIRQQAAQRRVERLRAALGLLVFGVAAFAEAARLPFDLPEAEQELVGGYHTEYFGIKLLLYLVAEYIHMITAAFLIVILFLGGWHFWGLTGSGDPMTWSAAGLRVLVLMAKVLAMIFFFMLARWSWPRFRFDQLMSLAWLVMLPLGLVNVVAVACWMEYGPAWPRPRPAGGLGQVLFGWAVLLVAGRSPRFWSRRVADNRPRHEPIRPSFENEEVEI